MKKNFRLLAIVIAVAMLGLLVAAAQSANDTAKDPVCGMSLKIEGATHTAEYLGKTYYFCSEDCKAAFLKDPAKFAAKKAAESPAVEAKKGCCMCCPCCCRMSGMKMKMMHKMPMKPGMMGHMSMGACLMAGKAEIAVENTPDGAVVRITSKDPEAVKMIQEHLAAMKAACAAAACPEAKKAEEKKEK